MCAVVLLTVTVAASPGVADRATRTDDTPRSTAVTIATPEGRLSAYLVNARRPGDGLREVRRAIRRAEGEVVQAWRPIGVVVVHSTSATFRRDLRRAGGRRILSVGATRTTAVAESVPGRTAERTGGTQSLEIDDPGQVLIKDPRENGQWDMQVIGADLAHQISTGSPDVVVGVLDSGIDPDHPDLAPNLDRSASVDCSRAGVPDASPGSWQPSGSDHGTHVAGTIAAARNGVGIVGVAPHVRIASVKVVNDDGLIYPEYAVCGFMWAGLEGMSVTNNSYYVDPFAYYCADQPDQAAALKAVGRAVAWSTKQGVVHAAAAGNSATDLATNTRDTASPNDGTPVDRTLNRGCLDIPAELPGVVTVSAYARQSEGTLDTWLADFSNRGLGVIDIAAPGDAILSTVIKGNGYALKSGTSMATPHVAGVLALLVSTHPEWTPRQLRAALADQADDRACAPAESDAGAPCVGTADDNSYAGEGMVDALDAVLP